MVPSKINMKWVEYLSQEERSGGSYTIVICIEQRMDAQRHGTIVSFLLDNKGSSCPRYVIILVRDFLVYEKPLVTTSEFSIPCVVWTQQHLKLSEDALKVWEVYLSLVPTIRVLLFSFGSCTSPCSTLLSSYAYPWLWKSFHRSFIQIFVFLINVWNLFVILNALQST